MAHSSIPPLWCLTHQLPEDQATPLGVFCPHCKQRLYTTSPQGRLGAFWESQPGAYTIDGAPMFVFTLMWDDFRIRSLHPAGSLEDPRGERAREYERYRIEQEAMEGEVDPSLVPIEEDFSHLSVTFGETAAAEELEAGDESDAFPPEASGEASEEPAEEKWLDIPEPESWLEIDWKPEDSEGPTL